MSKRHTPEGRAEADTAKGELRKPDDYSNQPGQSWTEADPGTEAVERATAEEPADVGHSAREYGHGSGDRNTMRDPKDFRGFGGGIQRDATPHAPTDPAKQPDRYRDERR